MHLTLETAPGNDCENLTVLPELPGVMSGCLPLVKRLYQLERRGRDSAHSLVLHLDRKVISCTFSARGEKHLSFSLSLYSPGGTV